MKFLKIIGLAATTVTLSAGPALAKGHDMPADAADFGQAEVASQSAENADARGLSDGERGVDGRQTSSDAQERDHPGHDTPAQPNPQD